MTLDDNVVLSVDCDEPEGKVKRNIRLTELSFEKVKFLIDKLSKVDVIFNDYTRGDPQAIVQHFISQNGDGVRANGLMWDVDDVGMFILNEIRPLDSANAHFVFWDKRFRGREHLCREMVRYVLDTYSLHRVRVEVPTYAEFTLNAVDRIGFTLEGRMREAVRYKGTWFDMKIFSMIRSDFDEEFKANPIPLTKMVCANCGDKFHRNFQKTKRRA